MGTKVIINRSKLEYYIERYNQKNLRTLILTQNSLDTFQNLFVYAQIPLLKIYSKLADQVVWLTITRTSFYNFILSSLDLGLKPLFIYIHKKRKKKCSVMTFFHFLTVINVEFLSVKYKPVI